MQRSHASISTKALSTLATIIAELGDKFGYNLSPNSATVAVFGDIRRIRRL